MGTDFHNTIDLKGSELKEAEAQAKGQTEKIYDYFVAHPNQTFTPTEIHNRLFGGRAPITSIRRAITDLTKEDKLMKTKIKRFGDFGKVNYCWMLNQAQLNMFMR